MPWRERVRLWERTRCCPPIHFLLLPICYLEISSNFFHPRGTKIIRVLGGVFFGLGSTMSALLTFLYLIEFIGDLVAGEGLEPRHVDYDASRDLSKSIS